MQKKKKKAQFIGKFQVGITWGGMAALGQNKYEYKIKSTSQAVVEHTFNPSTWESDFYEFQASLICKSKF